MENREVLKELSIKISNTHDEFDAKILLNANTFDKVYNENLVILDGTIGVLIQKDLHPYNIPDDIRNKLIIAKYFNINVSDKLKTLILLLYFDTIKVDELERKLWSLTNKDMEKSILAIVSRDMISKCIGAKTKIDFVEGLVFILEHFNIPHKIKLCDRSKVDKLLSIARNVA